jgi:hypothetical protein
MNVSTTQYIKAFEQMLETALAESSIDQARPMTDIEIQCLVAYMRKNPPPKQNTAVYKDLEATLFNMVELIKQEKDSEQEVYARKLLRRIGEVAMNINTTKPDVLH